jgi:hypothetical protein
VAVYELCTTTSGFINTAQEKDSLQQKGLLINAALQKGQSPTGGAGLFIKFAVRVQQKGLLIRVQ